MLRVSIHSDIYNLCGMKSDLSPLINSAPPPKLIPLGLDRSGVGLSRWDST